MNYSALMQTLGSNLTKEQCMQMARLMDVKESKLNYYVTMSQISNWLNLNGNWKTGLIYLDVDYLSVLRMLLNNRTVNAAHLVQHIDQYLPYEANMEPSTEYASLKQKLCDNLTIAQCASIARLIGIPSGLNAPRLFTEMERFCYVGREDVAQLFVIFRHPTVKSDHFNFETHISEYQKRYTVHQNIATEVPINQEGERNEEVELNPEVKPNDQHAESNENEKDDDTCRICMDRKNKIVFDCGHLVCLECCKDSQNCPYCRCKITVRIKLYKI